MKNFHNLIPLVEFLFNFNLINNFKEYLTSLVARNLIYKSSLFKFDLEYGASILNKIPRKINYDHILKTLIQIDFASPKLSKRGINSNQVFCRHRGFH